MDGILPYSKLSKKADLVSGKVPASQLPSGTEIHTAEYVTYDSTATYSTGTVGKAVKDTATSVASHTTTLASHSSQIDDLDSTKAEKTALALTDKKLDYLAALTKGQAWSESTGTTPAYSHTVAKGAKAVEVKKIGGKTIKYNQLVKNGNFENTDYWNVLNATKSANNNELTIIGAEGDAYSSQNITVTNGHKYYITVYGKTASPGLDVSNNGVIVYYNGNTASYTYAFDSTSYKKAETIITIASGTDIKIRLYAVNNTVTFKKAMCIDLTDMFGSGNEPATVDAFKAIFPSDYYPYSANTLLSADVTAVTSKEDDGTTTMGTLSIPQVGTHASFSALFPLRSAGSVYDEIDIVNKKHIKRIGVVDLGTLTWTLTGTGYFIGSTLPIAAKFPTVDTNSPECICSNYLPYGARYIYAGSYDKGIAIPNNNTVWVRDSSYTDAAALKTALSGVYFYYELATEVETDISDYFTDDNLLDVEYNGTLSFTQGNKVGTESVDVRIPVPNSTTYMINNAEATA